jgi:hypothetical protein
LELSLPRLSLELRELPELLPEPPPEPPLEPSLAMATFAKAPTANTKAMVVVIFLKLRI